jgi:formamidopyrimidine-DNA glycosylase
MPELPEVETIVRDLRRLVTGAELRRVSVLRPDLLGAPPIEFATRLEGRSILAVERRAKNILVELDRDLLVINLGMTGRVLVREPGGDDPPHVGVVFELRDGRRVLYQDVRRFGRLEALTREEWEARERRLGVEPLSPDFTPEWLHRRSRDSRVAVKTWLMDQKHVVGVGNIYASEALFRAGVRPSRPARRLTRPAAARIHAGIVEVLREAIDFRGTTLLDYRDAAGQRGEFALRLRVYDRAGEPCRTCATPIRRIVQGGRSTFFCPRCQR